MVEAELRLRQLRLEAQQDADDRASCRDNSPQALAVPKFDDKQLADVR